MRPNQIYPLGAAPAQGEEAEEHAAAPAMADGEETAATAMRQPVLPTQAMIDDHEVAHLPFRSWCPFCVRGRGQSQGHFKVDKGDEQIPLISVDYGFLGTRDSPANETPILLIKDRLSKSIWAHPVPNRGLQPSMHGSEVLLKAIKETGYKRLTLKSDQEPSIRALCNDVQNKFSGEIVPEASPKESHEKSNGEAEATVKQVHGLVRTLREFLMFKLGNVDIPPKQPGLAWMVEHAGTLQTLYGRGEDGLTPWHRLKGKPWRVPLPCFGEVVEFKLRTRHKLEARWRPGVFLGVRRITTEKIVGDKLGTYVVQSIRRVDEGRRWNAELFLSVSGTPWNPGGASDEGGTERELPQAISVAPELPGVAVEAPKAYVRDTVARRVYITRRNLEQHGYTAGCPACEQTRTGMRAPGLNHSEACRLRMERALASDPAQSSRLEQADERVKDDLERRVRANLGDDEMGGESPAEVPGRERTRSPVAADAEMQPSRKRAASEELDDSERANRDVVAEINELLTTSRLEGIADMAEQAGMKSGGFAVCEEPAELCQEAWVDAFYDDISGRELDPDGVAKARGEELEFIDKMGVWDIIPRSEAGVTVIKGRWVDVNKGDEARPNYRCRYVAKEFKRGVKGCLVAEFFAAMPPLWCSKTLLIIAVTTKVPNSTGDLTRTRGPKGPLCVKFIDVKRAHFVSKARRRICVELPEELRRPGRDDVGLCKKTLYGTRDAAVCWEMEVTRVMVTILSFTQGRSSPCLFFLEDRNLRVEVHGDDFEALGSVEDVAWLATELAKIWMIVDRGTLGPPGTAGTVQEMRHLNRLITWDQQGITWEADPRHAGLIIQELGISSGAVSTPLEKEKLGADEDDENDVELAPEDVKRYQSLVMRAGYLAQDRTDLQRAVRELAKGMKDPRERHWMQLKRLGRYLVGKPRVVQRIAYQDSFTHLTVFCDSDHAGCIRTRKSTSGAVVLLGRSQVRSLCRGQAVIALSSGEAEYYCLVTAASEALGEQSILADWGIKVKIHILMDATAGKAIGSRRGLGKVKHLDTIFLWVQEHVTSGRITIGKIHTTMNFADILTKAVAGPLLMRLMEDQGFRFPKGRAALGFDT